MTTFNLSVKATEEDLLNAWLKNHNKSYLVNNDDLVNLVSRKRNHIRRSKFIASIVSLVFASIFGYWIYTVPKEQELTNILLTCILVIVVWIITYFNLKKERGVEREIFDSLRQFQQEWREFKKLQDKGNNANRYYLSELGKEIATAARRKDTETEKVLMKRFKQHHKILLNFGIITSKDYGDFIPKPQSILETGHGDRVGL